MRVSSSSIVLPLALATCTSMLAMDLFLPALPALQRSLAISATLAQATIAIFLAGFALSQLLWGEALLRIGPRRAVQLGLSSLLIGAVGCALAPSIEILLSMRLLQGLAAGAAPIVATSVIRATLGKADAIRGIAAMSTIEAIVPCTGPLLGLALIYYTDWQGLFWFLSAVCLLVLPLVVRATPLQLPGLDGTVNASYSRILANSHYRCVALSHALCVGALWTFVSSAPLLMANVLSLGPWAFAWLQLFGVATFAAVASQAGRISVALGPARSVQVGACVQLLACFVLLVSSLLAALSFSSVAVFWCAFCAAHAVRGPAAFSEALSLPPVQMGRASAMLGLAILFIGAMGAQAVAPFMDGKSASPLVGGMFALCLLSLLLVVPYPAGKLLHSES